MLCFRGQPDPGWVDKCAPGPVPLPANGQACGWLLLKGQAFVSPGLATTERDPRSQMGPWQLSLPGDGIHSRLVSLACVGGPTSPPHRPWPCPSSGFVVFCLVLPASLSLSDGPKVRVLLSCHHCHPGQALPTVGLHSSTVEGSHIPLDCSPST